MHGQNADPVGALLQKARHIHSIIAFIKIKRPGRAPRDFLAIYIARMPTQRLNSQYGLSGQLRRRKTAPQYPPVIGFAVGPKNPIAVYLHAPSSSIQELQHQGKYNALPVGLQLFYCFTA